MMEQCVGLVFQAPCFSEWKSMTLMVEISQSETGCVRVPSRELFDSLGQMASLGGFWWLLVASGGLWWLVVSSSSATGRALPWLFGWFFGR